MIAQTNDVSIRTADPADAPAITALANAFHREDGHPLSPDGPAALMDMLRTGSGHGSVLVMERRGEIVGYAVLCFGFSVEYGGRDAFVDDIYVVPQLRGRGHGGRLYAALERAAQASGCRALHLEVVAGNRAEQWYRTLGFVDRSSKLLSKRL